MGKGHDAGGGALRTKQAEKDTARFERAEQAAAELETVLGRMKQIPGMVDKPFENWETAVQEIQESLRSGRIRIAVAGAIKSGKSTLINSMAGDDFLKRGAGVATSIVTRIHKGESLSAKIRLKSWDEINSQIEKSLQLLERTGVDEQFRFDLRKKKDRQYLAYINEHRLSDISFEDSTVRMEKRILENALQGYAECRDIVRADEALLEFPAGRFEEHKRFTGEPAAAFFVKDVRLVINTPGIKEGVEFADCQGADSTDPAHLTQILKYLGTSNMIVYVISSRTGLREADVNFLCLVRDMGLVENILFVVNCDISEHQGLEDFLELEKKIQTELSFFKKDVELFCFSSLFNLFKKKEGKLLSKDADRLAQWRQDTELVEHTRRMTDKFNRVLGHMIEYDRCRLLLSNHVERLHLIAENVKERIEVFSDLLGRDNRNAEDTISELKEAKEKSISLELIFRNSTEGVVKGLKREIESNLDFHFNKSEESFVRHLSSFVENRAADHTSYKSKIGSSGFSTALHLFFFDFAKALDRFAAETIMPKVIKLVINQEKDIIRHFKSLYDSYSVAPGSVTGAKEKRLEDASDQKDEGGNDVALKNAVDLETVKRIAGIEMPDLYLDPRYSGRIRAGSLAGFGIDSMAQVLRKFLNKNETLSMERGFNRACARMKKEVLKSILKNLSDYESTLKNQYFYPLVEAYLRSFHEVLSERFRAGGIEIEKMEELVRKEQSEKDEQKKFLETLGCTMDYVPDKIDRVM